MSNENEEQKDAPKIIVDSDWKEQVAQEKQAAAEQAASTEPASTEPASTGPASESESAAPSDAAATAAETPTPPAPDSDDRQDAAGEVTGSSPEQTESLDPARSQQLPEPTFEILVSMLFTQALSALGQMPNPIDGKTSVDKPMAKHSIDMLDMLSTKTKGNLSDDESKMLSEALHALRMGYVSVRG